MLHIFSTYICLWSSTVDIFENARGTLMQIYSTSQELCTRKNYAYLMEYTVMLDWICSGYISQLVWQFPVQAVMKGLSNYIFVTVLMIGVPFSCDFSIRWEISFCYICNILLTGGYIFFCLCHDSCPKFWCDRKQTFIEAAWRWNSRYINWSPFCMNGGVHVSTWYYHPFYQRIYVQAVMKRLSRNL